METWIGRVEGLEDCPITGALARYDCRNNRLAGLALEQDGFADAVTKTALRLGTTRIGVFVGTSTSGIAETESAYGRRRGVDSPLPPDYRYRTTHSLSSLALYVRERLGLRGPAQVMSTACSSSAKAFASAHRHMAVGMCDAAVVGGVDTLCHTTLYGFRSLGLVSDEPCRPWDVERRGISIGEAGGFALLERTPGSDHSVEMLGYGETSDGYHMSTPQPNGDGSALALERALALARIGAEEIDYINLHGTGTKANDIAEDKAIVRVAGSEVPCSSTKGWTGHTLGAAGITEAVVSCLCIEVGLIPGTINTRCPDPALKTNLRVENETRPVNVVVSDSFGFGGSNCSLVFGKSR